MIKAKCPWKMWEDYEKPAENMPTQETNALAKQVGFFGLPEQS